jgi:hypothetical protein
MSDGKYFQTTKKGEIHELKEELNSTSRDKIKEAVRSPFLLCGRVLPAAPLALSCRLRPPTSPNEYTSSPRLTEVLLSLSLSPFAPFLNHHHRSRR